MIEPKQLVKLGEVEAGALVWSLERREWSGENMGEEGVTMEQKETMVRLLEHNAGVFQEFGGLPPNKGETH